MLGLFNFRNALLLLFVLFGLSGVFGCMATSKNGWTFEIRLENALAFEHRTNQTGGVDSEMKFLWFPSEEQGESAETEAADSGG